MVTSYLAVALLVLAVGSGWILTLVGMPGNWLMVLAAALYVAFVPTHNAPHLGWTTVAVTAILAAIGEAVEMAAGLWGAKRAGGSRRAGWFSLVGSLAGGILGAGFGSALPVVGSLAGAVLGSATGAMAGAALAEYSLGGPHRHNWRVGRAAFVGRLLGTGAKVVIASVIVLTVLVGMIW
jgi:uncharacterized protein YqgC (DUF456 family)